MHQCHASVRQTAFDGRARGAAPRPGRTSSPPRGVAASSVWEESFSRKDIVTPEVLGKDLHQITPPTRHFFSLRAPEFSRLRPEDPGRGNRPGLRHRQARTSSVCCRDPSYVATTADSWTVHNRAFIGMTCPGSARIPAANRAHIGVQGDQGEADKLVLRRPSLMSTMSSAWGKRWWPPPRKTAPTCGCFKYF
ncbi:hypothetical protein GWK47_031275 [Chionoecetes opilio]|uniref:Uncharacterized protein n=1 Tax=Chionoecetes opilio TaxID=41210 RepID=A0A8J4YJL9_CHIOP|nr:hypothetical protein GWK47_031275 [Chionoecetes opilio]